MEQTDDSIGQALQNLPHDLSATFSRILMRSRTRISNSYQQKILGHLLGAIRPLKLGELREALGIVVGDTTWNPERHVNNIYNVLACCGSLIVVAEEERTLHFIHQSVVQFLLQDAASSLGYSFTLAQQVLSWARYV